MNYRIVLSPDADADIGSGFAWYHSIDPNLAFRFVSEAHRTMDRMGEFPYRVSPCWRRASTSTA